MGITTLYPRFRSNSLFAILFFMTRIVLHIILALSYFFRKNRMYATDGSFVPAAILTLIIPLHVTWFIGCMKGFIRRAGEKCSVQPPPIISLDISVEEVNSLNKGSKSAHNLPSPRPFKLGLSRRRQSIEKIFRSFGLDVLESPSTVPPRILLSSTMFAYIPPRQTVFEYVGLGKGKRQSFPSVLDKGGDLEVQS